jgi:hypothetical protein
VPTEVDLVVRTCIRKNNMLQKGLTLRGVTRKGDLR